MPRPTSSDPTSTAAFSLTVSLVLWIEQESKRRGVSKALIVREALEAARSEKTEKPEQEAVAA